MTLQPLSILIGRFDLQKVYMSDVPGICLKAQTRWKWKMHRTQTQMFTEGAGVDTMGECGIASQGS